jgi:hypothetical protein
MEADWSSYDTEFVEKCIAEFDAVDPKGMAFRYNGEGAEPQKAGLVSQRGKILQ